jgi:hypothetical protein
MNLIVLNVVNTVGEYILSHLVVEHAHELAAALVVFAGTAWVTLDASGFTIVNLCLVALWLVLAVALVRWNKRLAPETKA